MSSPQVTAFLLLSWPTLSWLAADASADLKPDEVALIANGTSRQSLGLAKYYADKRQIPRTNICAVDMPLGERLSRDEWQLNIRPAIRKWLGDPKRAKIRCLVTTWDVPLKIGKASPLPEDIAAQIRMLSSAQARRLEIVARLTRQLKKIAPDSAALATASGKPETVENTPKHERAKKAFQAALDSARQRIDALETPAFRQTATQKLQQTVMAGAGMNALAQALANGIEANPAAKNQLGAQLIALQGRIQGFNEARALIEATPLTMEHHYLALSIIDRTNGLFDSLVWIDGRLKKLRANETNASFDSELSCVLWPDYNLLLWQQNYLNPKFANSPLRDVFPTMMVSRIDAPTLRLCKSIVDTASEVEQSGLQGTLYLDGRGMAKPGQKTAPSGSYQEYDLALMATADRLKGNSRVDLVYQNEPRLFRLGECPGAALYCGWYSVAKYVDAFDWNPGAVAYHLASFELKTLRDPESEVWCKRMLEDGVCATIGAVQEPYLQAFPRPDLFFPLLLEGEKTLVECYYETKPFNSWAVALIGDPLYRPFK